MWAAAFLQSSNGYGETKIMAGKILIVDDCKTYRALLKAWLGNSFEFIEASSAEEAFEILKTEHPDCMVLDNFLPGQLGYVFIHRLNKSLLVNLPPTALLSGNVDPTLDRQAKSVGASEVMDKNKITQDSFIKMINSLMLKAA